MRRIICSMFTILILNSAYAGDSDIEAKINKLNSTSIESLGISLNALSYLISASPNGYIPLSHLEDTGKIHHISELEEAGYVKVSKRRGLPGGQQRSETFVNVRPIKAGKDIQRYIQNL